MTKSRNYLYLLLVLILAFCVVSVPMTMGGVASADDGESLVTFKKEGGVKIAHLTDNHYFPLSHCGIDPNGINSEYISGAKLLVESSLINAQSLRDIASENPAPDYLLVTGDITYNGELQGHVDMANMLRALQNEIRNSKPNFQVFVTPGNHDIHNSRATKFVNGVETLATPTTRADFMKIYASLGYPDMTDAEMKAYYDTLDITAEYLPYTPDYEGELYINSTTASNLEIIYQYEEVKDQYEAGEMTYIAYTSNGYVFLGIDEEVGGLYGDMEHHTGGKIFDNTKAFLTKNKSSFEGKKLIGMLHHNVIPHFPLENTLLKDFTLYNWRETADFLADLGVRYAFTGHMHSNDIVSHTSFDGNFIMDTETSSVTGYKGGVRYIQLDHGTADGKYAERYSSIIELISEVDFTLLFEGGWMSEDYLVSARLDQFVTKTGGKYICTDISEYAKSKLFVNILDNMIYPILEPSILTGLADMLAGFNVPDFLKGLVNNMLPIVNDLVDNLIDHMENIVLDGYTYGGNIEKYKSNEAGYKLFGYISEILEVGTQIPVNSAGETLFDFAMGGYLKHVSGLDISTSQASELLLESLENFKNGSLVETLLDILLDEETGLLRIVKGLTMPMDLGKGMEDTQLESLKGIFSLINMLGGEDFNKEIDPHAIVLDDYVEPILGLLDTFMGLEFSLEGKTINMFLDDLISGYLTNSLYRGLGEIAYEILYQFNIDDSPDGNFDSYTVYDYHSGFEGITYIKGTLENIPTIENGKLPSMLTVTFGADPKTDKNFVWFTDRRVLGTDIQYMEGTSFVESSATNQSGTYLYRATTTAAIDLGIFATLLPMEIGRHSIELTGLNPGTTYSYRVGSRADGFWSPVYTFTTAPDTNAPFELLLLTDLQGFAKSTYQNANRIMNNLDSIFENGYDFVINSGDVVDNSRNLRHFEMLLNEMRDQWGNTTHVIASGNHEEYSYEWDKESDWQLYLSNEVNKEPYNYLLSHFNFSAPEGQASLTGAYYSFDYSGVHFTILNTNDISSRNELGRAQTDWLKADLESAEDKIKIVVMHKGLYTAGSHNTDADVVAMRKQLTPIFADYGVSLVLQGHDHTYTESYYLDRDGNIVENENQGTSKVAGEGVLYVNLGSMGDKFYQYVENDNVPIEFGQSKHNPTLSNPTFGKLYYDGENIYYVGYEYDLSTDTIREIRYVDAAEKPALTNLEIGLIIGGAVLATVLIAVVLSFIGSKKNRAKNRG